MLLVDLLGRGTARLAVQKGANGLGRLSNVSKLKIEAMSVKGGFPPALGRQTCRWFLEGPAFILPWSSTEP